MLTRLEVDGFKNLLGFSIDFGPFTCIAGPNGVGKSNIFDVIRFLSLLTDHTLTEAALLVRSDDAQTGDPLDLFWTDGRRRIDQLTIAAEMLVEPEVVDDFGREAQATSTFLRYELALGYEEGARPGSPSRLVLRRERLGFIAVKKAPAHLHFPHSSKEFRSRVVRNSRFSSKGYIETRNAPDGQTEILVRQDGKQGRPASAPAASAPRTIIGTSNTFATPTVLAARREMQRWRLLALEPSAMRLADRFHSPQQISTSGHHLPATLFRLAGGLNAEAVQPGEAARVYSQVANRLAELVPVRDLRIDVDEVRQLLTLHVKETEGGYLPARSLSDGTLRFLALAILQQDPEYRGVICIEEPENGIHPLKLEAMAELLRDLAVDPSVEADADNPLRQVITATHSPHFVQLQKTGDLLFALETQIRGPLDTLASTLRCLPLRGTWRHRQRKDGRAVSGGAILGYLTSPPGAQLTLPELQAL